MQEQKAAERELADRIVYCSEIQYRHWTTLGVPQQKGEVIPLWVDFEFWRQANLDQKRPESHPLKVAAVGCGSLAKGLPYLLEAARSLGSKIQLSLVGEVSPKLLPMLNRLNPAPRLYPFMSREQLRAFYASNHLLVMPSLGDSFGFVAMEAMATGIPVVVTENCGVPVPEATWRVPTHDTQAIANRFQHYLAQPEDLLADSSTAREFAQNYHPQRYRDQVIRAYAQILE